MEGRSLGLFEIQSSYFPVDTETMKYVKKSVHTTRYE
jgi:hypothetical protein